MLQCNFKEREISKCKLLVTFSNTLESNFLIYNFKSDLISSGEVSLCLNNYETSVENTGREKSPHSAIHPCISQFIHEKDSGFSCVWKNLTLIRIIWIQKGDNSLKN